MEESLLYRCDWCGDEAEKLYTVELGDYRFVVDRPKCHWELAVALSPAPLTVEECDDIMEDVA